MRGHQERDPRVPDLPARQDHARPGGAASLRRQPPGAGAAPRGGRDAGRSQRHYYTRLERGNLSGVSEGVLEALARALQLDEAERRTSSTSPGLRSTTPPTRRRPTKSASGPSVQRILDAMTDARLRPERPPGHPRRQPARARPVLRVYDDPARPANNARFIFLDPRATVLPDWESVATTSSRSCAPKPAATRTTGICPTSSASCRPQRGVPHPLGRAQRPLPPHRHQAPPPPVVGDSTSTSRRWTSPPTPA